MATRREELAEAATDYALEHGLIGLSLRPLAAALGTSDRMLLYHFRDKDDLVATILRTSTDRSVASIRALPAVVRPARARCSTSGGEVSTGPLGSAASGSTSRPRRSGCSGRSPTPPRCARPTRAGSAALADHLAGAGLAPAAARQAANLVDAAFMGLQLDLPLDPATQQRRTVARPRRRRRRRSPDGRRTQGSA